VFSASQIVVLISIYDALDCASAQMTTCYGTVAVTLTTTVVVKIPSNGRRVAAESGPVSHRWQHTRR